MSTETEVEEGEVADEFEAEAREMGWKPQDKFRGNPEKWTSAKEFVEKGRHVLPIVLDREKRIRAELLTKDAELATLRETVKGQNTALDAIEKKLSKIDQQAMIRARATIAAEIKEARASGDVDAEIAAQDRMAELRNVADEKPAPKPAAKTDTPAIDPALKSWMADNPWFGDQASADNRRKTTEFIRIKEDLVEDGFQGNVRQLVDAVEREYDKRHKPRTTDKVEGGGRSSGNGASSQKGYASLPKEAKEACMDFADSIVGPGKRYKTVEDWQKKYAKDYFEEQA